MVQLQNFFFFIIFMVVLCGTAAPLLLKWFASRDVSTGAPFFNGTIIPILLSLFSLLVYLHSRKFIRSIDRAKSAVFVRASRPLILPDIIGSSQTRARKAFFLFLPLLHWSLLQCADFSYLSSFSGVLSLLFFRTLLFPADRSAKRERAQSMRRKGLRPNGNEQPQNHKIRCSAALHPQIEIVSRVQGPIADPCQHTPEQGRARGPERKTVPLPLPRSRQLIAMAGGQHQKAEMKMKISHAGVSIFLLGLLLSNAKKIQFTQPLPLGSELHIGKERCSLRGIDHLHGPTSHSICGNLIIYKPDLTNHPAHLLLINFPASYNNGKLEHFIQRCVSSSPLSGSESQNPKHHSLTMFPEKRYFQSSQRTSTAEVAIHTNLVTDLYASIGTGSVRTGGWYTTIIKLPFIFFIRIGFLLASLGGLPSLLRQLKKDKLRWNRES